MVTDFGKMIRVYRLEHGLMLKDMAELEGLADKATEEFKSLAEKLQYDMDKDSVILLEQLRTIDKKRLKERGGGLDNSFMGRIDRALQVSLGLNDNT